MKTSQIIVFFAVFFTIYFLVNGYIFIRGWQALPSGTSWRLAYAIAFSVAALAFIIGRFLERVWLSPVSVAFVWIGSFWLAAMLYFFLAVVVLDVVRLANAVIPFYPQWVTEHYIAFKQWVLCAIVGVVGISLLAGHINAIMPQTVDLSIEISKPLPGNRPLVIAMASDIHLGTIIGRWRLARLVDHLNSLDPDLILLPGDIVDEDLGPVINANLGEQLRGLRARYGVYAVPGNHEWIGGVDRAVAYLQEHGITVLRDSVLTVAGGVMLVGREDRTFRRADGTGRKSIPELLVGKDVSQPIIVMDHQPFGLSEASDAHVDLQVSGHTHHGQLWPFNLITKAIYEDSWGYIVKGTTHIYVSSGYGTWGPPVRLGNRPEVVRMTMGGSGGR